MSCSWKCLERIICKEKDMAQGKRITWEERLKIQEYVEAGFNAVKIGKLLDRHNVSIYRELKRCKGKYNAEEAQKSLT